MPEEDEGLLSQDDINAALAEAGLESEVVNAEAEQPAPEAAAPEPAAAAESAPAPVDNRVDATGRPFDEVAAAMAQAIEEEKAAAASAPPPAQAAPLPVGAAHFQIPELGGGSSNGPLSEGIELLKDVELNVKIELGRSRMLVDDVLRLAEGSVVELDKLAGDPVDVYVNDRLVAHGEVLVLNDNFCVRINDIVRQEGEEEQAAMAE